MAVPFSAHAECGGQVQCIGVGATPAAAAVGHHGLGPDTFTMGFGNQAQGGTSTAQTIHVAAVAGAPAGSQATLGAIVLGGADPTQFTVTGGSCSPTNGPVHNGANCTITVAFAPTSSGAKSATLTVPLNPPCAGCITGRSVTLTGTGFVGTPPRADPAREPGVAALVGNQTQTVGRFSSAQISNFQQRMEFLHRGAGSTPRGTASGYRPGRDPATNRAPVGRPAEPAQRVGQAPPIGTTMPTAGAAVPWSSPLARIAREPGGLTAPEEEILAPSAIPASLASALVGVFTTGTMNLSHSHGGRGAGSGASSADGTGFWISGNVNFGSRERTSDQRELRFTTDGVSAGVDRRLSDRLAVGVGLGYARDRSDIGDDGTRSESQALSISVYGSYQPTPRTYVDGMLGYGILRIDSDRYVAAVDAFARAHRRGDQLFGSLAAGYEHRGVGYLLSPYARFDFAVNRLRQVTESGSGANDLTYFEHRAPNRRLSLGLRGESVHQASFGWVLPRARVELQHNYDSNRVATLAFADQVAGAPIALAPASAKRNSLLFGIGSEFLQRSGVRLGFEYQVSRLSGLDRFQSLRLWLAQPLDGRHPNLPLETATMPVFDDPLHVDTSLTWDDNLSRARNDADKRRDNIYGITLGKSFVIPHTSHTRLVAHAIGEGTKHQTYRALDRLSVGARAEYQLRTSADFDAPTFGVFTHRFLDEYDSQLRTGHRYAWGLTARRSLTDRVDLFGAFTRNSRQARNSVFDADDVSVRVNVDYALGREGTLYLGGEYRRGDLVFTGTPNAEAVAISKQFTLDEAFGRNGFISYRTDARALIWTFGWNVPLGPRDSLDFSWRHVFASAERQSGFVPTGLYGAGGIVTGDKARYDVNQLSAAYLMRF